MNKSTPEWFSVHQWCNKIGTYTEDTEDTQRYTEKNLLV